MPVAIDAFVEPEANDIVDFFSHHGVLPIQIWLLGSK